jgi:transposase
MSSSILHIRRSARRRLQCIIRKSKDPEMVRRATALLHLRRCGNVTESAKNVAAARSTVYRWIGWFEAGDVDGLRSLPHGRQATTVTPEVIELLQALLAGYPEELGYLRTRWSSELLSVEVRKRLGGTIHASTVRRLLPVIGYAYRQARPFLYRTDPRKASKLHRIKKVLEIRDPDAAVFYVDEADVNLNPKIGSGWRAVGVQEFIPTPGQNEKRYLAGALHAHTGKVVWVEAVRKNSDLFIKLLIKLRRTYRRKRRIILILDNVNTHRSRKTNAFLRRNPKFELVFQPVYHPWVNQIERLWKALHDTVTRNHHYKDMEALMAAVRRFMEVVQPFPGACHGVAQLAA